MKAPHVDSDGSDGLFEMLLKGGLKWYEKKD
jgi:hypothetical protein